MNERPPILIVDDVPQNLRLYTAILADLDIDLHAVDSAAAALDACQTREFAAILLDVSMPEMDGFEAARRLRGLPTARHVPIVCISAIRTESNDVFTGYEGGAVDYLVSPVAPRILRAKVAVFADLYRLKRDAQRRSAELAMAHRALQQAYGELESFSYCAAHDLRAPLMQIATFARFIEEDHAERLDAEGRLHLEQILAATRRMNELIDDMLELARLTRSSMQDETVDLSRMAGDIAARLTATEPARRVEWRIAPGLVAVHGDHPMLHSLLQNLLGNAWKYTGKTAAAIVEFGAEADGVFFVRDNGAGFDMAHADKLFKPFERLHGQGEFPGTGVGLAICQRIVARHGGEIRAEGEKNRGACVYFSLGSPEVAPEAPSSAADTAARNSR